LFFFQAEDGIRDRDVTGVQTCALPISLKFCRHKGSVTFIHRADRLAELLIGLEGRAGEITVFPLWPKDGEIANRVIVRARKGIKTPMQLMSGLTLHEADGGYTPGADAALKGGALHLRA